jgi:uncharacterized protein YbjT (DUF2867 family)
VFDFVRDFVVQLIAWTGYIGGSVLTRLLTHPKRRTFDITILVRTASKVRYFEMFGLNVIVGSLDNLELLEFLAHGADVVFQCVRSSMISGLFQTSLTERLG